MSAVVDHGVPREVVPRVQRRWRFTLAGAGVEAEADARRRLDEHEEPTRRDLRRHRHLLGADGERDGPCRDVDRDGEQRRQPAGQRADRSQLAGIVGVGLGGSGEHDGGGVAAEQLGTDQDHRGRLAVDDHVRTELAGPLVDRTDVGLAAGPRPEATDRRAAPIGRELAPQELVEQLLVGPEHDRLGEPVVRRQQRGSVDRELADARAGTSSDRGRSAPSPSATARRAWSARDRARRQRPDRDRAPAPSTGVGGGPHPGPASHARISASCLRRLDAQAIRAELDGRRLRGRRTDRSTRPGRADRARPR